MQTGRRRPNYLDVLGGAQAPGPDVGGAMGGTDSALNTGDPVGAGLGVGDADPTLGTDMLSDEDLAALAQQDNPDAYDQLQVGQMEQSMQDPNLPPDQRAMLEQQLALAARRRMAGV